MGVSLRDEIGRSCLGLDHVLWRPPRPNMQQDLPSTPPKCTSFILYLTEIKPFIILWYKPGNVLSDFQGSGHISGSGL